MSIFNLLLICTADLTMYLDDVSSLYVKHYSLAFFKNFKIQNKITFFPPKYIKRLTIETFQLSYNTSGGVFINYIYPNSGIL